MNREDAVWLGLGLAVLGWELRGVYRKQKRGRDTITDYARGLRDVKVAQLPLGFVLLAGFWTWVGFHFFVEGH